MLKLNKFIYFFFILVLFLPSTSYAYIDPGSGSILIQMLLAFFASILTVYHFSKKKIINFFKKLTNIFRGRTDKSKD